MGNIYYTPRTYNSTEKYRLGVELRVTINAEMCRAFDSGVGNQRKDGKVEKEEEKKERVVAGMGRRLSEDDAGFPASPLHPQPHTQGRSVMPRDQAPVWVPGAPQRPPRSHPRSVAGGGRARGEKGKGGRGERQPRLLRCYLTAQQPQLRGWGAPRSARPTHLSKAERAILYPRKSPPPPHHLLGQRSPSAQ